MKKHTQKGFLVGLFMVLAFAANSSAATELKFLSAFAPNFIFNTGCTDNMTKNLVELSGGQFKIRQFGPDVIPTFEQFQPVQSGVFDLSFTHATYHAGTISVGVGMDATMADPVKRRESGLFDLLDKEYNKLGIKLVSLPPVAPYHFITRNPLGGQSPSLQGLKMRSNPSLQNTILALGGSPVTMAGGDVYTSLQKGVIDGAAWTLVGVKGFKWQEVADYMVRPTFGSISMMITMNLAKYNSLTPKERTWIDEAGKKTELDSDAFFKAMIDEEIAYLKGEGMKETVMSPEDAKNVEKYWNEGLWKMAQQTSGDAGKKFQALALQTGMTR
jgi:TRAP-type C4-dicarboxylate transport system substrate-binding protein